METMKALVLENVERFALRDIPRPQPGPREVLLQVGAVGVCGTDFHIFQGRANYNLDATGRPIPLSKHPQILGHEICGTVVEVGRDVKDPRVGDRVLVDQGLNCYSQGRDTICEYCGSGDSHQCDFYQEHGITGLPGAMADFIAVPACNTVKLADAIPMHEAGLIESLGCILHAVAMADRAPTRYGFGAGRQPVRNALILGAGPAGRLFAQALRQVKNFDGRLFITDIQEEKLRNVEKLGATPINARRVNLIDEIRARTQGQRIDYLIEACGAGSVFAQIPGLIRKQATVLMYAYGHESADLSLLNTIQFKEAHLITATGASGALDPATGRPLLYQESMGLVAAQKIQVNEIITHRYTSLTDIQRAFTEDGKRPDYIKGVLVRS